MIDERRPPSRQWNEDKTDFFEVLDSFRQLVEEDRKGTHVLPMGIREKMEKFLRDIDEIQ